MDLRRTRLKVVGGVTELLWRAGVMVGGAKVGWGSGAGKGGYGRHWCRWNWLAVVPLVYRS